MFALFILVNALVFLQSHSQGTRFIDATHIRVCHNKRISSHKVFKGLAALGNSLRFVEKYLPVGPYTPQICC